MVASGRVHLMKDYEIHVTIDPCEGWTELELFIAIAKLHGFKVANLIKRNGAKSDDDEFCTAHDRTEGEARSRTRALLVDLMGAKFSIRRWKIELIVADSRRGDFL